MLVVPGTRETQRAVEELVERGYDVQDDCPAHMYWSGYSAGSAAAGIE